VYVDAVSFLRKACFYLYINIQKGMTTKRLLYAGSVSMHS